MRDKSEKPCKTLYTENYKTLLKEIKEDISGKSVFMSWKTKYF